MTAMQQLLLEALVVEGFTGLSLVDQSAGKLPITSCQPRPGMEGGSGEKTKVITVSWWTVYNLEFAISFFIPKWY